MAEFNIMNYGGNGDGTTANDSALASLRTAMGADAGRIYLPAGKYRFNSAISFSLPSGRSGLTICGDAPGATTVYFPNAAGGITCNLTGTMQSVHIADMSITTNQAGGGQGITIAQSVPLGAFQQSTIDRVTLSGDDNLGGAGSKYWTYGYYIHNVSGTAIKDTQVYGAFSGASALGIGGLYQGDAVADSLIYHSINSGILNNLAIGLQMSNYVQGIAVDQSNIQNSNIGFYVAPGTLGDLEQVLLSDTQFACTGEQIYLGARVGCLFVRGCPIFVPAGFAGIDITAGGFFSLIGNQLVTPGPGIGGTGIRVAGMSVNDFGTIIGNPISSLALGVDLTSTSRNTTLLGGSYIFNTQNFRNLGSHNVILGGLP